MSAPERIGKYPILGEVGRGATAIVYLAEDLEHQRKVALKLAVDDPSLSAEEAKRFQKLFLNEASLAGKLNHPNIVSVFDAHIDDKHRFLVMEYVPGGSLKKFCTERNLLPLRQVVLAVFKCARALDYAFQNGVIHRDIKPANILVTDNDETKISDFGTARISHSDLTQIEGFIGSPAYMSPEQINEEPATLQGDIYALGVVMYELLTGRLPYLAATSVAMINKILNEDPTPLESLRPDLPQRLIEIAAKAMAKNPKDRYSSWFLFAKDLADTFPQLEKLSYEISSTEKFNRLRELPFFSAFRDAELWEVLRGSAWESHGRDEEIVVEGETGESFYVFVAGTAKVIKDGRFLAVLKAGDCFGEMSYLQGSDAKRSASVVSVSEAQVIKLKSAQVSQLSEACQLRFNQRFLSTLVNRLSWTNNVLSQIKQG